jgi:hypothetical protein
MNFKLTTTVVSLLVLAGCGPSKEDKARIAEQKRIECLDHICEGDAPPSVQDHLKETVMKFNGQWFIAPKSYFSTGMNGAAFYWPSKTPARPGVKDFPEKAQATSGQADHVTIEIFLHSQKAPLPALSGYDRLKQAEAEGRLISKENPRPGLEVWKVKDKDGLRPGIWYVATELKGFDGQPPVVWCDEQNPQFDRCSTGGLWKEGITWDTRFRAKHGPDWPEIFQETSRVLQLIKKA